MKHRDITDQAVRQALEDCLSGVKALPSMRGEILRAAKGEMKVKKKLNMGLVLAMILVLLTTTAAVAAELGLFSQLGQRNTNDTRLPALDGAASALERIISVPGGVTVTIDQAYYDGTRVFLSYSMAGPFDQYELGEGKPDIVSWDAEHKGEIYGESFYSDAASHSKIVAHLDGSAPRWARSRQVNIHDGLQLGEGYADIIGGDSYLTEDGTLIGWKECTVPAELAADEVTFSLGVYSTDSLYYQTDDCLYESHEIGKTVWHDFTVKKDFATRKLTGTGAAANWAASAELVVSAIDAKGEVRVNCPESWHTIQMTWENPDRIDYISDWQLYLNGTPVEGSNLDWRIGGMGSDALIYGFCYRLDEAAGNLLLVPVYRYRGAAPEEGLVLTAE